MQILRRVLVHKKKGVGNSGATKYRAAVFAGRFVFCFSVIHITSIIIQFIIFLVQDKTATLQLLGHCLKGLLVACYSACMVDYIM